MENSLSINNEKYTYNDDSLVIDGDIIQIGMNHTNLETTHGKFGLVYLKDNKYFMWEFYQIKNGEFECNNLTFDEFLQDVESNKTNYSKLTNIYTYDVMPKDKKLNEIDYFSLLTKLREIMHVIMPLRKLADSASKATNSIQSLVHGLQDIKNHNYCFVLVS